MARLSATPDPVIAVGGLRKSYGSNDAVRGIDLEVRAGEIFAFLGPNGAGKTTTVEILEGYRVATAGDVRVLGVDPREATPAWRHRVGVVLQDSQPEPELTARECLQLYAGYYAHPLPVDETLAKVGLDGQADTLVRRLSGGQRRRLDFGLALIGDPELLFLDEPTTGFDPSARHVAWSVIAGLRASGTTIFLTTHYMDEAEFLADRIAVIAHGEIVAEGTPRSLGGRDHTRSHITFSMPLALSVDTLPPLAVASIVDAPAGRVALTTDNPVELLHDLTAWAMERGLDLADIEVTRPTLEQIYLRLTGDGA